MKVTLLGLEFASANMGCEALAYSFANEVSKVAKELEIDVEFTSVLFDIKPRICVYDSGQEVKCLPIRYKKIGFWTKLNRVFRDSDLIVDFTGGDSFSDIYGKKRFYMATLIKRMAIFSGTPFVLGPQTYGPYRRKLVKQWAKTVIRKSTYVFARDEVSKKVAEELSGRQVKLAADVAFALPYEQRERVQDDKIRIGLNPSGLLWDGGYEHAKLTLTVEHRRYCEGVLERLLNHSQYEIYLISHVGTGKASAVESDYEVCKILHKKYPQTVLVDVFDTPMAAKTFIAGLDVLIAARMHATIAAFSTGVATIPFSYSRKFEGLYNSVAYEPMIHACTQTTEEAIVQTIEYVEDYKQLKEKGKEAMEKIQRLQDSFEQELKNIVVECR